MNEPRDDLDRALSAGLGELAAPSADADAVLTTMRPRLRRARTRHRVVRVSVVALALLGVAGVAGALSQSNKKPNVSVSHPSSHGRDDAHNPPTTLHRVTSTTAPRTAPKGNGNGGVTPTTGVSGVVPVPDRPGGNSGPGSQHNGGSGPVASTTTVPAGQDHTYFAAGGSVTIRYANGEIHIVSVAPVAGCAVERHDDGPDRVEVRFQNCPQESRIGVDLNDGHLVQENS